MPRRSRLADHCGDCPLVSGAAFANIRKSLWSDGYTSRVYKNSRIDLYGLNRDGRGYPVANFTGNGEEPIF